MTPLNSIFKYLNIKDSLKYLLLKGFKINSQRFFDPFHYYKYFRIIIFVNERQKTFINWLLSIGSSYLFMPLGTNILDWLTGKDLIDLTRLTLSVILAMYGAWLLLIIYNKIKE